MPCLPIFAPPLDLSFAARVCQGRPRGGVVLRLRLASDGGGRLPGDFAPAESIRDTAEDTCRPRQLRLKWSWIQPGGWAVCSILHQRKVGAKRVGQGRTCEDVRCTPSGCGAGSGSGSGCAHVSALGTGDDSLAAATASPGSAPQPHATIGPVLRFGVAKVQTSIDDRWLVLGCGNTSLYGMICVCVLMCIVIPRHGLAWPGLGAGAPVALK